MEDRPVKRNLWIWHSATYASS